MCNLISVIACCDSLYVRINFDVKKTATGHGIAESWSIFVTVVVVKEEDAVTLCASLLKLWVWSTKDFCGEGSVFHINMLVKHFCFEDNRTRIFGNLSKRFFFFLTVHLQRTSSVCSSGFFGSLCFKCPCQYFVMLHVNDSSIESLVTVPWLNNCKVFFFPLYPKSWKIRKGNGSRWMNCCCSVPTGSYLDLSFAAASNYSRPDSFKLLNLQVLRPKKLHFFSWAAFWSLHITTIGESR